MLLTRYTFVNTLQRMKPLLTDWALPLPVPAALESGSNPDGNGDIFAGAAVSAGAAAKRDMFMARMSRRVMRNSRRNIR